MNLLSCNSCGVVLDKDKLIFPDTHNHDSQELIKENAEWNGEKHVSIISCPACDGIIREEE